jgi:hypothetical protein
MITNTGKNILAKYLIGQAPSYASYMAFGSGARPRDSSYEFSNQEYQAFANKEYLDFELFRTPITSRGYVTEVIDGEVVSKVVLTAELPPEERYQISEIGIFSARSNPSASGRDSRMIYTFTEGENWQYHNESTATNLGPVISEPFYSESGESGGEGGDILDLNPGTTPAFFVTSDNTVFASESRQSKYEGGRYLNTMLMVPGNMSYLEQPEGEPMRVKPKDSIYHGSHIHYSGITLNLEKNSSEDLIKTAFTLIARDGASTNVPPLVMVMIEFSSSDSNRPSNYARLGITVTDSDILQNRYVVDTQTLSSLETSENFSWSDVNIVKVYATVFEEVQESGGEELLEPSSNFFIGLDGLRLENVTSQNPLYGLSGYSSIRSDGAEPLVKIANSSNLVEFRFGLEVA